MKVLAPGRLIQTWHSASTLVRFNIVAFACTVVTGVGLGWWLGRQLEEEALAREADIGAREVLTLLTPFLRASDFEEPLAQERLEELDMFIGKNLVHNQIRRVKIWTHDGTVVFGSDMTGMLDGTAAGNAELDQALSGIRAAEIVTSTVPTESSSELSNRFMEIYIPIRLSGESVIGAYEIDQDLSEVEPRIAEIHRSVWLGVAAGFALLYLALLSIVRSGSADLIRRNRELERERATLAGIMRSMGQGLFVLNPDQSIRYGNDQAARLLGLRSEPLTSMNMETALSDAPIRIEHGENIQTQWREAYAHAEHRPSLELTVDGPSRRDVALEIFPLDGRHSDGDIGVLVRDVTKERELERAKDELVAVVSHELRTPLAALVGFADLLLARTFSPERQQEFLGVMVQEGHRLTSLINDFLDLQHLETGVQTMSSQRVDLTTILESVVALGTADASHSINLAIAGPLPILHADPDRLMQVLTNLVSNAQKYSPEGGAVSITAIVDDGQVKVGITDHGLGLPPEALDRLFTKFYRVDNSDRRAIKGTGLGLAICQTIIASHGGRIWAESEGLGQGSSFYFTLPVDVLTAQAGDVLIVEDDPGFGRLLKVELSALGRAATHVTSAESAITITQQSSPSAVVLDLNLPGASGEDFLRQVPPDFAARVPVLVVTATPLAKKDRARLAVLGVSGVVIKSSGAARAAALQVAERLTASERGDAPENLMHAA